MDISEANRKVAISRWSKIQKREREQILPGKEGIHLKSLICGFLAGDGSVQVRNAGSYNKHQIDFFPDDKFMLEGYIDAIKKVYNKTPTISRRDNVFTARISSRTITEDLLKNAKFGLNNWEVPFGLFEDTESKKHWLMAFFSAEGYVNKDSIKIQTINKKGMSQVSDLLNGFSINHKCYNYNPKNSNYSEVYIIRIDKKEDRKKFLDKIGFMHSNKMKMLKNQFKDE